MRWCPPSLPPSLPPPSLPKRRVGRGGEGEEREGGKEGGEGLLALSFAGPP